MKFIRLRLLVRALVAILVAGAALAGDAGPDFAGVICTPKLSPALGKRPVLAILWDPREEGRPVPAREEIEKLLFGPRPSVADWFRENSCGKLEIERAGLVGWVAARKPAAHYWRAPEERDADGDGWLNGHVEKWTEAIRAADEGFDFARHDANRDGRLDPHELGILVVIPQAQPFGTVRTPAGREAPDWKPLVVDGVEVPAISEWYTGAPPNFGAPAHELCHLLLGAPDMYMTAPWPFAAAAYSLMDQSYGSLHLDPFEKLKLGWARPSVVLASGERKLRDVETTGEMLVLHDPRRGPGEYFLVENRWRGESYDHVPQSGLAVWHIVEDPKLFDGAKSPTGTGDGDWGRNGIRLVRANGGTPVDDTKALLDRKGARLGDDTAPAKLRWLDGAKTGFEVELASEPGAEVVVRLRAGR